MVRRNRWIAALLSASLVFTMMPAGAVAAEEPQAAQTEEQMEETVQEDSAASSEEETAPGEEETAGPADTSESEGEQASVEEKQEEDADKEAVTDESAEGTESDPSQDEEAAAESGEEVAAAGASETAAEEKPVIPEGTVIPGEEPEMAVTDGDGVDPDDKYEMFINRAFFGSSASGRRLLKASGRLNYQLSASERLIYDKLVEAAQEIARGERDNGRITIPITDIIGEQTEFTAEELGLGYIVDEAGQKNPDINQALMERFPIDYAKIQDVLIAECPYEMFPLSGAVNHPVGFPNGATYRGGSWVVYLGDTISVALKPNANFALESGDKFAINSEKIRTVLHAADTAQKIVDNASGMSDYYKLCYYKEKICDLVSYDEDARDQGMSYEDKCAWTLLNVFDGDPSTNVVCEGYSEAFQYLCDLTNFSGDTYAYCVTGLMDGGTGSGDHKWNIVHIDSENYLADITNSDSGAIGSDGKLFLAGMTGSVDEGYTKKWPERHVDIGGGGYMIYPAGKIDYYYDSDTTGIYTTDELTIAGHDYGVSEQKSADDKASLKGLSLYLTDKIGMRVYVKPVDGYTLSPDDSIVFTCNGETKVQKVSEADEKTIEDYNGDEIDVYVFGFELWTKQMTDEVSFHMVVDGVSGTDKIYSVRSYADEILRGGYSEDEKAMVRAMLNYGGYAQKCFDYKTGNLANGGIFGDSDDPVMQEDPVLGEEYKYTLSQADDTKGFKFKQASLMMTTDVSLVYSFKLDEGKTVDDYNFRIKGSDKKPVVKYNDYFESDCVVIEHILPYELDKMYELEVIPKGESAAVATLNYGPFSYCRSKIAKGKESVKNVCKAIYYYWKAAGNLR